MRITSTQTATTCVYVPSTFDPSTSLPAELQQYVDCARYLLHRIIWGQMQKRATKDEFVCLKFDYLRGVIPDRVIKPLKAALIESGVIECDGYYQETWKAFGYRLGPSYQVAPIIRVNVEDAATRRRVQTIRRAEHKRVRLDVHRYLRSQFKRLEIDLPLAMLLLQSHSQFELVKVPLMQISAKDFSFSVCRFGRVHTDLTRCPGIVRSALSVDGMHLVSVDLANSQPLFLSLLLINYRKERNNTYSFATFSDNTVNPYRHVDAVISRTTSNLYQKEHNCSPPPLPLSNTTRTTGEASAEVIVSTHVTANGSLPRTIDTKRDFLEPDEQHFVRLCEQGRLYEHLMDRMEMPVRKWVKEGLFEVFYGKNSSRSRMRQELWELFPHVGEVIRVHKKKDHRYLACLMQNYEATVLINRVCRRLMAEWPVAPIFTIHDSILTTPEFVKPVQNTILEEFALLGLTPTLHVTNYGELQPHPSPHDLAGEPAVPWDDPEHT